MSLEETVKNWLSEENLIREVKFDENSEFHIIAEFPKDNIMDIVQPKGSDCIVIACATQVAPQHLDLINGSDVKTRREFNRELNFGLNNFLVDYELQMSGDVLQQFVVTEQLFEDGLSKNELIKTIKRVFKSKLHCIWLIDKFFGTAESASNENHMFV